MPAWLSNSDWIFYTLAAILAPSGIWLLYRGIFKDRSKGKRRCPRCWYDMSGIPAAGESPDTKWICPECGSACNSERRLFRTRRHWRAAAVGVLLGAIACASFVAPAVLKSDWTAAVPTTVLALFAPADAQPVRTNIHISGLSRMWPPKPPTHLQKLTAAMWARIDDGSPFDWQSRLYLGRVFRANVQDPSVCYRLPEQWVAGRAFPITAFDQVRLPGDMHSVAFQVKDTKGRWVTLGGDAVARVDLSRRGSGPAFEYRILFGLGRHGAHRIVIDEGWITPRIKFAGTASDILAPIDTPGISEYARRALSPAFLRFGESVRMTVGTGFMNFFVWGEPSCALGIVDYTLRAGGTVIARGRIDLCTDTEMVLGRRGIVVDWLPGGETLASSGATIQAEFGGNHDATFDTYDPFRYGTRGAWTGTFTCDLSLEPGK